MRVLDATFLVDYGNELDETAEYLLKHSAEEFVIPSPVLTEYLLGMVHGTQPTDIPSARAELSWAHIAEIDEDTATTASEIADEIGEEGPDLTGIDSLVAAVGRELGAPVVSNDTDLTHDETKKVVEVEEYR
ncbi:MAG: putative nucleic acid-binding protein [Methanobacteriota archaeon]|jgi:predicted nucleic acid-binding protein